MTLHGGKLPAPETGLHSKLLTSYSSGIFPFSVIIGMSYNRLLLVWDRAGQIAGKARVLVGRQMKRSLYIA